MSSSGSSEKVGEGLPDSIGPYRVLRLLGSGGMGEVYLAERLEPRLLVALKVVKLGMDTRSVLARFEIEREALAMMGHTTIARMLDAGATERGQPYFAMEYVPGLPLTDYCARKKLDVEARLQLFLRVCEGVQHAHQKGVIHRDLKPGNILVMEQDDKPVPKIIDFGLARAVDQTRWTHTLVSQEGKFLGTLPYMSPEQADEDQLDIDTRTDIYSLGVILYELLTGEPPFTLKELREAGQLGMLQILREKEPPTPSQRVGSGDPTTRAHAEVLGLDLHALQRRVRGDLDCIALCALEKDRTRRYPSVSALAANIRRHLRNENVEPAPHGILHRLRKWCRRHRRGVAAGALTAASLLAMASIWVWKQLEFEAEQAEKIAAQQETVLAQRRIILASDPALLRELARQEREELWPAWEATLAAMEQWLEQSGKLIERLPEHRAADAPSGDGFVSRLAAFQSETVPRVVERYRRAKDYTARSVERHAAAWERAVERIRSEQPYGISDFVAQPGLVPLGANEQGLQEFYLLDSGLPPRTGPDGSRVVEDETAVVLVLLPGGTFTMGAQSRSESGVNYDPWADAGCGPLLEATLEPFFIAKYELTQGQWIRLAGLGTGESPANFRPEGGFTLAHPVELVSWSECRELLRRWRLTLPTSARWEYACRAGSTTPWYTGGAPESLFGHANVADESHAEAGYLLPEVCASFPDGFVFTAPVGSFDANGFGLHDVHGNVFEWCLDGYVRDYEQGVEGPDGRLVGSDDTGRGMYRGGGFTAGPVYCRSAFWRQATTPNRMEDVGVRPAMAVYRGPRRQ